MEKLEPKIENPTKDISNEFLTSDQFDFTNLLRKLKNEPSLSITINFTNIDDARRLKYFLDTAGQQERSATIRATREQMEQDINSFQSGVKWEEV